MAESGNSGDYTGKRFTAILCRARPTVDQSATDITDAKLVEQWERRYTYEFPWPVEIQQVPHDSPCRTQFTGLCTVEELMKETKESLVTVIGLDGQANASLSLHPPVTTAAAAPKMPLDGTPGPPQKTLSEAVFSAAC